MKLQPMRAEDLYDLRSISYCRISPNGKYVIYVEHRVEKKTEKKYANLWIVKTVGGKPRQFTFGDHTDSQPVWSPDSKYIAFLSNRHGAERMKLYVIPVNGGEARLVSEMHGSFGSLVWSPDSKTIYCGFTKTDADVIEREKNEQKKKLGVVDRVITSIHYKHDGIGFLPKERSHIWAITVKNGKEKQITDGQHEEYDFSLMPDGKWFAICANHLDDPHMEPYRTDLWIVSSQGGEFKKIDTPIGGKYSPVFSPDGKTISYLGSEYKKGRNNYSRLWTVPADGSKKPVCIGEKRDVNRSMATLTDVGNAIEESQIWSADGTSIFLYGSNHGASFITRISLNDGSETDVIYGKGAIGGFSLDAKNEYAAYVWHTQTDPCDVFVKKIDEKDAVKKTAVNAGILKKRDIQEPEEVWFDGKDGKLQGWIIKPYGFDPKKKYPSMFYIHGGPHLQYGYMMFHEFYVHAANGYVVYYTNPHGSDGYGEDFMNAIHNNWGSIDYDDLMLWADHMEKQPYIDKNKMGVTGGSYGGYMTNWIIGHTNRFKTAVTARCVSNFISMWGSSDFNWGFQREMNDLPPWEDVDNYWRLSPMKYIGNAKTPTMVIHNEKDQRCEIEQGEQVYVALKRLGVDTELVRFPDEPHGLSRNGRTDRRIARILHIQRWFDKYLK